MDCYPVYRKFLAELRAVEREGGCISQTAPSAEGHLFDGSAGWSDAIDLIPWRMFLRYGDTDILKENYEKMKGWLEFSLKRAREDNPGRKKSGEEKYSDYLLDTGWHWGEWIEPDWNGFLTEPDPGGAYLRDIYYHGAPEVCTSHLSYGCYIVSVAAELLGKKEDAEYFRKMRRMTKQAYRETCMENGHMKQKRQCDYVHAIIFDMLTDEEKQTACDELNELILQNGCHLNTGFLSTYELLRVLTDYGHADTAYSLMLQDTCPGWLIDRAAGICVRERNIRIQPFPDRRLEYVKANYNSPMGEIRSSWSYEDTFFRLEITVPANAEAEVIMPDGMRSLAGPGIHIFECRTN